MSKTRKRPKSFGPPSMREIITVTATHRASTGRPLMPREMQADLVVAVANLNEREAINAIERRFLRWERHGR